MKKTILLLLSALLYLGANSQVAINTTGNTPDASAALDVSSTSGGVLIPRLSTNQRTSISSPANGLMVYDTETDSFWYYDSANAGWKKIISTASNDIDALADGKSDGSSIFLGVDAGDSDDLTVNNNIGIGNNSLNNVTTGEHNVAIGKNSLLNIIDRDGLVAIGYEALKNNGTGITESYHSTENTAIGYKSLSDNTTGSNNTSVGHSSLKLNTIGFLNTAFGGDCLEENISGCENVAIGSFALTNNTSNYNTSVGSMSMYSNTSGSSNVAIGPSALSANIEGNGNVGIGAFTNRNNQNGNNNTTIGFEAGRGASTHDKSGNIFLGYQAGYNETGNDKLYIENSNSATPLIGGDFANDEVYINGTIKITGGSPGNDKILTSDEDGNSTWEDNAAATHINQLSDGKSDGVNVFLGFGAGGSDNGDNKNTGIGHFSLYDNTSGEYNTSTGYMALSSNTTSDFNSAVGTYSLQHNTGESNTAIGYKSLSSNTSSDYNSAIGSLSLENSTGERNTAVGYYSLHSNTSGDFNTSIGYRTGYDNQTGSNNTFIGYNARMNNSTAKSNSTALGNDAVITASNQIRIGNGSVSSIGGYAAWTNVSDKRFKSNITEEVNGLDFILKLRPVTYNLDVDKINAFLGVETTNQSLQSKKINIRQSGFIAQEVEQAASTLGFDFSGVDAPKNETDHYGLRYAEFVVPLVKAVQEMDADYQQQISNLTKENIELKNRLDRLEKVISDR